MYTLWLFDIVMENGPCVGDLCTYSNYYCFHSCFILPEGRSSIFMVGFTTNYLDLQEYVGNIMGYNSTESIPSGS